MHCLADEEHCLLNIFFQLKKKEKGGIIFHYITKVHKKNGRTYSGLYNNHIIIRKRFTQVQKIGQMI